MKALQGHGTTWRNLTRAEQKHQDLNEYIQPDQVTERFKTGNAKLYFLSTHTAVIHYGENRRHMYYKSQHHGDFCRRGRGL